MTLLRLIGLVLAIAAVASVAVVLFAAVAGDSAGEDVATMVVLPRPADMCMRDGHPAYYEAWRPGGGEYFLTYLDNQGTLRTLRYSLSVIYREGYNLLSEVRIEHMEEC